MNTLNHIFQVTRWMLIACVLFVGSMGDLYSTTIAADVERELWEVAHMCDVYQAENGKIASLEELRSLVVSRFKNRDKVIENRNIVDPWGRPYVFCEAVDGSFVIVSLGDPNLDTPKLWMAIVTK